MRKLHEYQEHAKECRQMAQQTSSATHREQLTQMAETWEQLADARRRQLQKDGKPADESLQTSDG